MTKPFTADPAAEYLRRLDKAARVLPDDRRHELVDGVTEHIAEAQATAEHATYDEEALLRLLRLARIGCTDIFAAQAKAIA